MSVGLTFKETMKGPFALGETDPGRGKDQGDELDSELALHCQVIIEDLDRFVDDPEHGGSLEGNVDFTPWGEGLAGITGKVNLLAPTHDPDRRRMTYELGFEHDGRRHYLAGEKHLQQDGGFDLWKDTTTLFTRLHQGTGTTGEVVGAGVLGLGPIGLLKLVGSMRATGAESYAERARALETFGTFFLGGLWDTYKPWLRETREVTS